MAMPPFCFFSSTHRVPFLIFPAISLQGTSDSEGLMTRREEARMAKIREKNKMDLFGDDNDDLPQQKGS